MSIVLHVIVTLQTHQQFLWVQLQYIQNCSPNYNETCHINRDEQQSVDLLTALINYSLACQMGHRRHVRKLSLDNIILEVHFSKKK